MFGFFKRILDIMRFEIREIRDAEFESLQTLAKKTFNETYPDYIRKVGKITVENEINTLYALTTITNWIKNPKYICLGLYDQRDKGILIGYSLLIIEGNIAKLSKLYLLDSYQGKGLGRILIEENFSQLRKKQNIIELRLFVWDENTKARAFYERLGFKDTKTREIYSSAQTQHIFKDAIYTKVINWENEETEYYFDNCLLPQYNCEKHPPQPKALYGGTL